MWSLENSDARFAGPSMRIRPIVIECGEPNGSAFLRRSPRPDVYQPLV